VTADGASDGEAEARPPNAVLSDRPGEELFLSEGQHEVQPFLALAEGSFLMARTAPDD